MLCSVCKGALFVLPIVTEPRFEISFSSSFEKLQEHALTEKCFICAALWRMAEEPGSSLCKILESHGVLELTYGIHMDSRPRRRGLSDYDTVLKVSWNSGQLEFYFCPNEAGQIENQSWEIRIPEVDNSTGMITMEFTVRMRSAACPYCKDPGADNEELHYADKRAQKGSDGLLIQDCAKSQFSSNYTGSGESFALIQHWLDDCHENHPKCPKRVKAGAKSYYPTRLLDLQPLEDSYDNLRLVLSQEEHLQGDYMTLSHCWGRLPFMRLTSETVELFRKQIKYSDLTKSFQDAVTITRKLGIRYLWIDSLCIVQDGEGSHTDWLNESTTMDEIYQNSFLNIGATGAIDGRDGCFRERDYDVVERPVVLKSECKLHYDRYRQPYRPVESTFLEHTFLREPLLQRGWVFQERFLTPRMIHFGSVQMFWECNEMHVCESYPTTIYSNMPLLTVNRLEKDMSEDQEKVLIDTAGHGRWQQIITEYSSKALTRPEDKLIALSGVARQYAARMLADDDTYLAGIWMSDFPSGLTWTTTDQNAYRPEVWRAPSWSWASLKGKIGRHLCGRTAARFFIADIQVQYEPMLEDKPFGAVSYAMISVRGKLIAMVTARKADGTYTLLHDGDEIGESTWWPDEPSKALAGEILCLPICTNDGYLAGLSLTMKEDSKGQYLRTGAFLTPAKGTHYAALEELGAEDIGEEDVIELL